MTQRTSVTPLMRTVRDQHVGSILRCLLRGPVARKELAHRTSISFTTITRLVSALLAAGVIEELPVQQNGRGASGRPQIPLSFPSPGRMVIGTHVHAHSTTATAFTLTGEPIASALVEHSATDPAPVLAASVTLTEELVATVGRENVVGVGVSTGGVVDFESGAVLSSPQLGWTDVSLRTPFEETLELPVVADSSVRALAMSQLQQSRDGEASVLVIHTAGWVSAALIVDHQLHRGPGASAGTIAHLPVPGGPGTPCPCGSVDCLGVVVTDEAVLQQAIGLNALPQGAEWSDIYRARTTNAQIDALLRRRAEQLGRAVAHLVEVMNPDLTIVAGPIGAPEDVELCLDTATAACRRSLGNIPRRIRHWRVVENEWDRASAALVLDDYLRRPTHYETALVGGGR
ncbi:ROK family protein [Brachybacterium vulturis]|uniref:ROK family protein n=1 Tax=Brachybacterium vulturis TaxID=2017484 RepID=UPI00373504B3